MTYYRYNALTRVLTAEPNYIVTADGSPRTDGLYRNRGTGAFSWGADKTA